MAKQLDPLKLSSPRIFLFRMLVFVILVGLITFVLHKQIQVAFMANPGLNALIIGVLAIGIVLSFRQVLRLYPEIAWVNNFRLADPGLAVERAPVLLAPMAAILGSRVGRMAMSSQLMRGIGIEWNSGGRQMTFDGTLTVPNRWSGEVSITPAPGVATGVSVGGLNIAGTTFRAQATAKSAVPGTVQEVTVSNVSGSGATVWILRSNDTTTSVFLEITGE